MTKSTANRGVPLLGVLLAGCAGATDVLAFFGLDRAFAGNITGNLVTGAYGIATGDVALIKPTLIAVAGFIAGELIAARVLRLPGATLPLLAGELAILFGVLGAWLAVGAHPRGTLTLVLLALLAVALGGQSIWALRIHQTTTYFTGMLTTAISTASAGSMDRVRTSVRQLGALLAGAVLSGVVLSQLRLAAPAVPLVLLIGAIGAHIVVTRRASP
jgi:uncharacterized membrane protein YoaK (UPF0700 family)